ncbi:tyrosine-type recombinase/integrase [Mesorhizobium sp. AR07]|uniref:tyrosine-type recombinase/integrase n=1 Tax=Mesorhizobium sp. AR07 TaxID=2865838 RepID=UPI00215FC16C|nr:integrase arm-type DNA-binding domain-containing protein [Mesorhizobium sp. AR07]UVK46834.1 tyrosine-type recombinase/integrase [Mesorhizobium sp. AR07]
MALTDTACRNAKPAEKDYKLSDSGRLYLFVKTTGSKLWRMNYSFEGKQKTLSIGVYPGVTLLAARTTRDEAKATLAAGKDPMRDHIVADDRKFRTVAKAWFNGRASGWVSSYSDRIWSRIEDDVLPAIGDKDVAEIEPSEVLALLRTIEDRGALEMAKRVRQTVSGIFRWAVADNKAKIDPAAPLRDAMKRAPRQKHRAALREEALPEFFKKLHAYDGEKQTALGIEFVAHTFVRTAEFRYAKWEEFKGDTWRIPGERMKMKKEHIVPLTSHVQGLLEKLREESNGSEWVFPGVEGYKPISENTLLFALYRMGYRSRATIHGFRTTASTVLNESGLFRPDAIERQLSHVPLDEVRSAYNAALYLPERIRMMDFYSKFLLAKDTDLTDLLG